MDNNNSDDKDTIIKQDSPVEYFKEMVHEAIGRQKIEIDDIEEYYIVNLLAECIRNDKLYITMENGQNDEPLANILLMTLKSKQTEEQIKCFKDLGDFTLFISGFFADSLNKKLIDLDYYKVIGESAYSNLSCLMKKRVNGDTFYKLFKGLSDRFQYIVDIISEVSEKTSVNSNTDILRVYERWIRTGSRKDSDILQEKGIIPISNNNYNVMQ